MRNNTPLEEISRQYAELLDVIEGLEAFTGSMRDNPVSWQKYRNIRNPAETARNIEKLLDRLQVEKDGLEMALNAWKG